MEATRNELDTFERAIEATGVEFEEPFVTAASPGAVTSYNGNEYYDTHEEHLFAVADAMWTECESVWRIASDSAIDARPVRRTAPHVQGPLRRGVRRRRANARRRSKR